MGFVDDGELLADLIELDIVLSALGEERIDLVIILLNRCDEGCLRVAIPRFLVPIKRLGAIKRQLFGSVGECFTNQMLFGSFGLNEIFIVDVRHIALERAASALYLVGIAGVCVARRYVEVDDGSVGRFEYQLDIVLGIAKGVCTIHVAENCGHSVIIIKQVKCLIERMRAGVGEVAAVHVEAALPVPSACIAVELYADVDDPAQLARCDDVLDLFEIAGKARLLENEQMSAAFLCGLDEVVKFFYCGHAGLFAQNVKAVLEQVLGYRIVLV